MKRQEEARFNINQRVSYSRVFLAKKGGCLRRQSEWKSRYKGASINIIPFQKVACGYRLTYVIAPKKVQSGAKWSIPGWLRPGII